MPKIIENLKTELMAEAKRQVNERGYKRTTIRSVADGCGIAIGTVYNYFQSKDMLIASFILEDWLVCIKEISLKDKSDTYEYLLFIHTALKSFEEKYSTLFNDSDAKASFGAAVGDRHILLRNQLRDLILPVAKDAFTADFVAEAMLSWSMTDVEFAELYRILQKIIK